MRRKIHILVAFMCVGMLLAGCGTQLYSMTDEEQDMVTAYSAYVVSMHNTYQKDGLVSITVPVEETEEEMVQPETESETAQDAENTADNSKGSPSEPQQPQQEQSAVTLAEAIGHGGELSISFKGCKVDDHYTQGQGYSVTALEGRKYIIAEFSIKNVSDKTVKIDNLSLNPSFRCHYNGSEAAVGAEVTFLDKDLGSYEGKIKPGKRESAVLLFSIPDREKNEISDFSLSVVIDGVESLIKL